MRVLVVTSLLLASATPAIAQVPAGDSWTGFNAGIRAGWNFRSKGSGSEVVAFDTNLDGNFGDTVRNAAGANAFSPGFCNGAARGPTPAAGCTKDKGGLEWAVNAGFDYDLGGPVVGVVAEFGAGYARDSVSAFSTTPASYTMTRTQSYTYGVRGRAGYALGPGRNTLVYGTGGVLRAKIANGFRTSNVANSFTVGGDDTAWGWRAGAGIEQRVDRHLSIGLLYLYTNISDDGGRVRAGPGTAPATNPFRLVNASGTDFRRTGSTFNSQTASVTANVRF